jgi:hypothetical protein
MLQVSRTVFELLVDFDWLKTGLEGERCSPRGQFRPLIYPRRGEATKRSSSTDKPLLSTSASVLVNNAPLILL